MAPDPDEEQRGGSAREPGDGTMGRDERPPVRDSHRLLLGYQRGDRVGRFVLQETVGAGASGVVFTALDQQQQRTIAVKVIRVEATPEGPGDSGRLLGDAAALAALQHANALEVYEVGRQGNDVFIAMELVHGGTLAQWLGRTRRPWREVLAMMTHAGRGLAAAHQIGIAHLNFSPDNVLIGSDGRVRVADFGLVIGGTPIYAAPEQRHGSSSTALADQFAFCVVLFEALTGRRPAEDTTVDELQESMRSSERVAPTDLEAMPAAITAVIARGLAMDPTQRFESMDALLDTLERGIDRQHMLTLGIPASGGFARARRETEQLTSLFKSKFDVRIEAWVAANYHELVSGIVQERIDLAWLPPVAFAEAMLQGVRAVAIARRSGANQFRGALIVRANSDIHSIDDLAGCRMAWVDAESASGYLLPRALIAARVEDTDTFLGPQQLLGSHRAAVQAVLHGLADCAATFAYCDESGVPIRSGWQQYLEDRAHEIRPIAFTASIPGDAIAARPGFVSTPHCKAFVSALRAMVDDVQGRAALDVVFNQIDAFDDPDVDFYEQIQSLRSLVP